MRLYCNQCRMRLYVNHKIEIELSSEFDFKPKMLTLTNHFIRKSKDTNAFLETKKVNKFYCMDCDIERTLEQSSFKCDDCSGVFEYTSAQFIGESLILCKACLNGNKTLEFFKIFGKRGPSKDKRDKRTGVALEEANVEVDAGQILEELDRLNIAIEQVGGAVVEEVANVPDEVNPPNVRERDAQEMDAINNAAQEMERRRDRERARLDERLNNENAVVFGAAPDEANPERE